ncbi:hypothetical protein MSG28_005784 [Choristoneura fumiferana]|uniref:Uncharacterized protein n=1 Tax=Choristoneura fumiferana TaxID=7141 RepID=A0ACC0L095_CHOFU|nr:hypothetical protein MSG28_005784 [Choristoneura fumiferana]
MAAQNKESESEESMPAADAGVEQKERLIATVKKEVKQLMEEAVTRKFVHEDSGGVTALCGAVEACLGQGLRRRALGLFKTNSTTALLHKIAKLVYDLLRERPSFGSIYQHRETPLLEASALEIKRTFLNRNSSRDLVIV